VALHGKVFVAGSYRVGFCEKLLEASTMPNRANATGSKTDQLLAKAKPLSNVGSPSVMTYLRRGKSCCGTAVKREY